MCICSLLCIFAPEEHSRCQQKCNDWKSQFECCSVVQNMDLPVTFSMFSKEIDPCAPYLQINEVRIDAFISVWYVRVPAMWWSVLAIHVLACCLFMPQLYRVEYVLSDHMVPMSGHVFNSGRLWLNPLSVCSASKVTRRSDWNVYCSVQSNTCVGW